MHVCSWCGQSIGTSAGRLSGQPARNFGICPDCLHECLASLPDLPDLLDPRAVARARRMLGSGRNLAHIGGVLGVSELTVKASLRAA